MSGSLGPVDLAVEGTVGSVAATSDRRLLDSIDLFELCERDRPNTLSSPGRGVKGARPGWFSRTRDLDAPCERGW